MSKMGRRLTIGLFAPAIALAGCMADFGDEEVIGDMTQEAQGDCTPTLSANPAGSPQTIGTTINFDSVPNCPPGTVEYRYLQKDNLGVWTEARAYDLSSTFAWDTTGFAEGDWAVQVWVRRVGSGFNWEGAKGSGTINLLGAPDCSTVSYNAASPPSPSAPGTAVTISASATCAGGATAEYRFFSRAPGGGWTQEQNWSTNNSYNWDTTGATLGRWDLQVWSRAVGNPGKFDGFASGFHRLETESGVCNQVSIDNVNPASPSNVGDAVTITASATCTLGETPEFRYLLRDPTETWSTLQDWTTSTTANWNTTGAAAGGWDIQVWTRAQGSSAANEAITPSQLHVLQAAP